eukprot:2470798-Lingulodinium_polyedra.AAC.1
MRSLESCNARSAVSKSQRALSLRWHALCVRLTGGLASRRRILRRSSFSLAALMAACPTACSPSAGIARPLT